MKYRSNPLMNLSAVAMLMATVLAVESIEAGSPATTSSTTAPPNIIFIMADDLGYRDLGCYGQQRIRTPNIDRMAAEGMRLTDFYAGSTVCAPSRCVLLTGKHTGHAYIRGNSEIKPMGQRPLLAGTPTLAGLLQKNGYSTALIGKWGLGGPGSTGVPNLQGFDYFFGYLCQRHAHNYYPEFLFRNEQRVLLKGNRIAKPRPDGAGEAIERAQYSHDVCMREALDYIDRQSKEDNKTEPFFLYVALTIPHANNEAGENGMEVPDLGQYGEKDWPDAEKAFAAMVGRMDKDVGRILDMLKQHGIDDRTIVFFTSDNGPHDEGGHDPRFFQSSGPLRGIKRALYEGGIRVPMIARWPGKIEAGSESDQVSYLGDVFATTAELAGTQTPSGLDSISLLPTLLGEPRRQKSHPYLYWEFYEYGSAQAVREGRWKAIRKPMFTGNMALYDLSKDLGEQKNLAAQHPEVIARMKRHFDEAHVPSPLWKPRGEPEYPK